MFNDEAIFVPLGLLVEGCALFEAGVILELEGLPLALSFPSLVFVAHAELVFHNLISTANAMGIFALPVISTLATFNVALL